MTQEDDKAIARLETEVAEIKSNIKTILKLLQGNSRLGMKTKLEIVWWIFSIASLTVIAGGIKYFLFDR